MYTVESADVSERRSVVRYISLRRRVSIRNQSRRQELCRLGGGTTARSVYDSTVRSDGERAAKAGGPRRSPEGLSSGLAVS